MRNKFYRLAWRLCSSTSYVPPYQEVIDTKILDLQEFLSKTKTLVLTGAGISTESGIPDYRSEGIGLYARSSNRPIQYNDFLRSPKLRKRYWARNFMGWPRFANVAPNLSHYVLAKWEKENRLCWLVTQNVDALHSKAGHKNLTELHGCTHRIVCLQCDHKINRWDFQNMMAEANPNFKPEFLELNPDGDVTLTDEHYIDFKVPNCSQCETGMVQPDITFFGGAVPKSRIDFITRKMEEADNLLIIGSSVQVFSAFRIVQGAVKSQKPVAIINIGETRADSLAKIKVNGKCSNVLERVDEIKEK